MKSMNHITSLYRQAILSLILASCLVPLKIKATELSNLGLNVIPYPQEVIIRGENFHFSKKIIIVIGQNVSPEDAFTAQELVRNLKKDFDIDASISAARSNGSIMLSLKGVDKRVGSEGYQLSVSSGQVLIQAITSAGLFYGTQTLLQLIQKENDGYKVPALAITDWPSIRDRVVHYDTKHHQDKKEYVESFIRDLAHYKINMLVWEWKTN